MVTATNLTLNLHAAPCTNRCRHCWTEGSPRHPVVPFDSIRFVLDELASLRSSVPQVGFLLFDEPTLHPQFLEIMEHASARGLVGPHTFLATNGSVLAGAPDETWDRLVATGVGCLQLTSYGLAETHDRFAGRKGAHRDVSRTIGRAADRGLPWYAGVILHPANVGEMEAALSELAALDPAGKARPGYFLPFWQGRARGLLRVTATQFATLPAHLRKSPFWVSEAGAVERILGDPDLSARAAAVAGCDALVFQVDEQLDVYCGGSCDSGGIAAAVPELRSAFALGSIRSRGLRGILDRYEADPPAGPRQLRAVTWGQLAERFGDRDGQEMYFLDDLPGGKWAAQHLQPVPDPG